MYRGRTLLPALAGGASAAAPSAVYAARVPPDEPALLAPPVAERLPRLLLLSRANAGRSQMAAALWEARGGQARSAGTAPHGRLLAHAVAAMREAGLDIGQRRPRRIVPSDAAWAQLVVLLDDVEAPFPLPVPHERWATAPLDAVGLDGARAAREALRAHLAALAPPA